MASALAAQSCMARLVWMHIQRHEQRDDLGLVVGPQPGAPVGDAGDDDLDLPIGQLPRQPGVAGGREVAEPAAGLEHPVGGAGWSSRAWSRHHAVIDAYPSSSYSPRRSSSARARVSLAVERRVLLGDLDHRVGVRGDHEGLDRFGEPQLHPPSVHQFDRPTVPQNGL